MNLIVILGVAVEAFVAGPAGAVSKVQATAVADETAQWMSEYLTKAHEARLAAVARAQAETKAEAEAKIAELEAK